MSQILGLLTLNQKQLYEVDSIPSAGSGTPAPIGTIAQLDDSGVGELWVKVGSADTAWERFGTTAGSGIIDNGEYLRLPIYKTDPTGNELADTVQQNSSNIHIYLQAQPARSNSIDYRIPNPGNTISAADFVLTEGNQFINGDKTFGDNVWVEGNFTVDGSATFINSTIVEIVDKRITLNRSGISNSGYNVGFEVEEANVPTGYFVTDSSRDGWLFKAPASYEFKLDESNLTADRAIKLPNEDGTFVIRPNATPGVANQVAFWQDANAIISNANFTFDPITNTLYTTNINVSGSAQFGNFGEGIIHSDASGNLTSSPVVLTNVYQVSGILPVGNGGTNSGAALNNDRLMVSQGGAIVEAPALTNGELLIGATGGMPVAANITQGANQGVVITNGSGSIQLSTVQDIRTTASPSFAGLTLNTFTQGSVIFVGPSGLLSQDNANFFFDDANNRLGIGTNAPTAALEVVGSARITSLNQAEFVKSDVNGNLYNALVTPSDFSGILPIANGGTNSGTALVNDRIMVSSSGQIVEGPALGDGQILVGSSGSAPVATNIVGTINQIYVANNPGSIVLSTPQDIATISSPSFAGLTLNTFTKGSVLFAGSGGVVTEDNPNFFFDDANNRLGICTAGAPTRTLDVNGSSVFHGSLLISDATATKANYEIRQAQTTTSDNVQKDLAIVPTTKDTVMLLEARVEGRRQATSAGGADGDSASYVRIARIKNINNVLTIKDLQSSYTSEDQAAWNCVIDINGTNARIRIQGANNNDVDWSCTYIVQILS